MRSEIQLNTERAEPTDGDQKRHPKQVNNFFKVILNDLRLLIEWDTIERQQQTRKDQVGFLWLHRAILALKLKRYRLAERSFRNVVEQGVSFFAWNELLEMYMSSESVVGVLRCIVEIIDFMDSQGVMEY